MEIVTCKGCGKLFNYIKGQRLCPVCLKKLDDKFVEVKKYVYQHPKVEIHELSEEMDVSVRQIRQWIREERLCFSDDSPIGIECEGCGVTIKTGRFCKKCKDKLANRLSDAAGIKKPKPPEPAKRRETTENKMRFLDS